MKRAILIGMTLAGLTASLAAKADTVSASSWRNCGSNAGTGWTYGPTVGAGNFNVRARRVWCNTARHIVSSYGRWDYWHNADYSRMEFYRGAWTCYYRQTGYESARAVCKASYNRRIRWVTGA
jgi:hypothetical protein